VKRFTSFERWPGDLGRDIPLPLAIKKSNTQDVFDPYWPVQPLPSRLMGLRLGGGDGLERAQSRCKWWIEGMLHLVKAIEDAPEPRRRRPMTPQRSAHAVVHHALAEGTLTREPCEVCGTTEAVQAHHHDYSLPLDVHWLCQIHHKARHSELGTYAANGTQKHSARRLLTAGGRSALEVAS